jgi:hypothetical protein
MFNFGEFLSTSNFVWRVLLKKASHLWSKKKSFWSWIAQRNKYTCTVFNKKCIKIWIFWTSLYLKFWKNLYFWTTCSNVLFHCFCHNIKKYLKLFHFHSDILGCFRRFFCSNKAIKTSQNIIKKKFWPKNNAKY